MKCAIVAGGNGLIGRALVSELANAHIPVLVLGSSKNIHNKLSDLKNTEIDYYQLPRGEDWLSETIHALKNKALPHDSVFFNLAWRGKETLVDGDIAEQLKNVGLSCELVKLAKGVGAKKYVAAGSMEEVILDRLIKGEFWLTGNQAIYPNWYGLAKFSARMQSAFEAYQHQIDFCYAKISIVIDKSLQTQKYVEGSLKRLLKEPFLPIPKNREICNISSSEEIARQLLAIGKCGLNKRKYILGTGEAGSLYDHFARFARIAHPELNLPTTNHSAEINILEKNDFRTKYLVEDTGYKPIETVESLFREIAGTL